MLVTFSEDVDQTTAETEANYSFNHGVGTPSLAVRQGDQSQVLLTVTDLQAAYLADGTTTLIVTINNVDDENGNTIAGGSTAESAALPDLVGPQVIPGSAFIEHISGTDDKAWVIMEFDEPPFTKSDGTDDLVKGDFEVVVITADGNSDSYKVDDKVYASSTGSGGPWSDNPAGTETWYRVRVHENDHDAYTSATQIDVRVKSGEVYDAAGNEAPSGPGTGTGTLTFTDNNGPTVKITSDVDATNSFVNLEFSEDAYGPGAREPQEHDPPVLYNLEHDPGEHLDVAAKHTDIIKLLRTEIKMHRESLVAVDSQLER